MAVYWTLGRHDTVAIIEAPNEKAAMEASLRFSEGVVLETLTAVRRKAAVKLID